jgi:hypothetical protein
MITTSDGRGRLGNALFQNCLARIFSKKFNMRVESFRFQEELRRLNFKFEPLGENIYKDQREVTDRNMLRLLRKSKINHGLNLTGCFQLKRFVKNYREEILDNFDLVFDDQDNEDLFVHVRLGDLIRLDKGSRIPGIECYYKAIEQTKFKTGYISSDTMDHEIVLALIDRYNLIPFFGGAAETINFGKNFNNIVLSSGTFSWWIGFLSKAENIFYPTGGPKWHGDIFVFDEWTPITQYSLTDFDHHEI